MGDFLLAAKTHLDRAADAGRDVRVDADIEDMCRSLGRVVTAMGRYVQDVTPVRRERESRRPPEPAAWAQARAEARDALASAARFLSRSVGDWPLRGPAVTDMGQDLDAAAVSLAAGRDLLQIHFVLAADGTRPPRSDWAMVVTSPPVTRALLAELASMAEPIAARGTEPALSPSAGGPGTAESRRRLNAACQSLRALHASVRQAQKREPVPVADTQSLCAVPANNMPARRLPGTSVSHRGRRAAWHGSQVLADDSGELPSETRDRPGLVETKLLDLGVTSPDTLRRAAEIDRAGERLINVAAAQQGLAEIPHDRHARVNGSAGTTTLVNHELASGDPRAATLMHPSKTPQRGPPEREP